MKAMHDKIIAIITNSVLALALIVVAGTMGSDVTGSNEGEQEKLEESTVNIADANVSLLAGGEVSVGQSADILAEGVEEQGVVDAAVEVTGDVLNADEESAKVGALVKKNETEVFLVNVSEYLYVRTDKNSEAEVAGKIFAGQGGEVIWHGDEWSYIRSGNVEGYISNEYAWFGNEAKAQVAEKGQLFAVVTADKLNVRAEDSKTSTTLGMVVTGEKLEVVECGEKWTKVIFEEASAYVATDYVSIERAIGTGKTLAEEQSAIEAEAARQKAIEEEKERQRKEAEEAMAKAIANSGVAEIVKTSAIGGISAEDAYLIACCVSAEVGYSSYECQLAVANVILNRLKSGYGNTIRDVIYARNQFTVTTNGAMDKYLKNGPRATSVQAVKDALAGTNNMVGYYNFCSVSAANFSKYSSYIILGSEVFYRR